MPTDRPRTPEKTGSLQTGRHVVAAAEARGVTRVVHFTTVGGAVGILAKKAVKSRHRLPEDDYLEHVYQPNVDCRKDPAWLDYVNLSLERINEWMFETSARWHVEASWVLLSFRPDVLGHPGVVFTTTNNIYPACERAEGLAGFEAMFADRVVGRYGRMHNRTDKKPAWPTDRQAEVLYPGELSCNHLLMIEVQTERTADTMKGALGGLYTDLCVRHAPEVFL